MEEKPESEPMENSHEPHEALFLVLSYLPLYELLVMSEVCKSLREALNKDVLPWLNIIVQSPISSRLSDNILINIASKSNGRLTTLALINCVQITDEGLLRVIQNNPFITKLYLPGCTGLTPEGIITAVNKFPQQNSLETLHINGIYNITKQHITTLQSYLKNQFHKHPFFYHQHRNSPFNTVTIQSDPSMDVQICPKCDQVSMVYDCPRMICKQMRRVDCRGCLLCISRCVECGGCVKSDEEIDEAVCLDVLCLDCWLLLPKCSFCNRPYCKQHSYIHSSSGSESESTGFVCDVCCEKFARNVYDIDE